MSQDESTVADDKPPEMTPGVVNDAAPPILGAITPEEEARRRELAEQAARKYARWRPWVAPKGRPTGVAALLTKFNPFVTLASFLLFILLEAWQFGWPMAVGIALVIFVHECGHATAALIKRIPVTGIVLIPFLGGVAMRERRGETATDDAFIGILGPVFGVAAGLVCWALYPITGQRFFLSMTSLVMLIHLLNMLPIPPLDGSRILPLFQRPKRGAYEPYCRRVTDDDRRKYGALYGGIALFCLVAWILLRR